MSEHPDRAGHDRRAALKKFGLGAGIAWTAPTVTTFFSPAAAGTPPTDTLPPSIDECLASECGNLLLCGSDPDCICVRTSAGGFCVPATTPCSIGPECGPGFSCPPGMICFIDTCCGAPVCGPIALLSACDQDTSDTSDAGAPAARVRAREGTATFGG